MLPGQAYTPEDILRIVWRRKWLIVLPPALAAVCALIVMRNVANVYRSETVILVVPQRIPETYVKSTVTARIEDRLNSIQQQILSRSRLERVILDFNLYPEERKLSVMEDVVARMRARIDVILDKGDAFRITYDHTDPRLAQKVTERLASMFKDENLRDREVLAEQTNQFLDAELEEAKRRLIEHERRLEQYRRAHTGELPSQVETNLRSIQTAQVQLQTLAESLNRDRERQVDLEHLIAELEAGPIALATTLATGPAGDAETRKRSTLIDQLRVAQEDLRQLKLRYTAEHPDVEAAGRIVSELDAKLRAELQAQASEPDRVAPVDPSLLSIREKRLADLRAEVRLLVASQAKKQDDDRKLREVMAEYQAKVNAAPTRENEMVELMRDYGTLQTTYTGLLTKRQESKLAVNLERRQIGEQFKVLDPARVPERPFSPNRLQFTAVAVAGGLGFGLLLAAFFEYRNMSMMRVAEVVRVLQVPVFVAVPLMLSDRERRSRRMRAIATDAFAGSALVVALIAAAVLWRMQT